MIPIPKKSKRKIDDIKPEEYDDVRLVVHTQPRLTKIGKKKPEIFEVGVGGNKEAKLKFIKENLGKEIKISDVFAPGMLVNVHSVTKGKGTQGPVRRDGIALKSHKSEKSRRRGVLESEGLRKVTYRAHQQGKTGYNPRTEYNRWIMRISEEGKGIVSKGGFRHYGLVKNSYILIKGSVGGPAKRLIRLSYATRVQNVMRKAPTIPFVSLR
jgi:large subunit ribosomal protein L3